MGGVVLTLDTRAYMYITAYIYIYLMYIYIYYTYIFLGICPPIDLCHVAGLHPARGILILPAPPGAVEGSAGLLQLRAKLLPLLELQA